MATVNTSNVINSSHLEGVVLLEDKKKEQNENIVMARRTTFWPRYIQVSKMRSIAMDKYAHQMMLIKQVGTRPHGGNIADTPDQKLLAACSSSPTDYDWQQRYFPCFGWHFAMKSAEVLG
jgi:hypothetical protein